MPLALEDYSPIGDTRTAALVGRNGSTDRLCLPRFDVAARETVFVFWRPPSREPAPDPFDADAAIVDSSLTVSQEDVGPVSHRRRQKVEA